MHTDAWDYDVSIALGYSMEPTSSSLHMWHLR